MIRDISGSSRQPIDQECNIVYDYLRQRSAIQSPPELIQEFQNLLQQGRNEDTKISRILEKIIFAPKPRFEIFLSHCFYLILDCWLDTPESMDYVDQLANIFEALGKTRSYDRRRKQLVQLVEDYQQTASYLQVKAVIAIIHPQPIGNESGENFLINNEVSGNNSSHIKKTTNTYLLRYPYLYQHLLPSDEQFKQLHHLPLFIEQLRDKRQQDFEILLSQHIIYRFRLKQVARMKLLTKGAGKMITKVDNPSLLSERAFRTALKQYVGKIDNKNTTLERAQRFVVENELCRNYGEFKQNLYNFIVSDIKPRNNTYKFSSRFQQKLADIFPQSDAKSLNRTLILQTCRQLFSFLIVDHTVSPNPQRFAELISNLGTAQVMMMLVKITLICPESKSDLEKKICSIVSHYQLQNIQEILWLIKSLEHLLVAFSIYFGNLDVSLVKSAITNQTAVKNS